MNIVIVAAAFVLAFVLVKPVQAVNDKLVYDLIPSLMNSTLKLPVLGEVLASEEIAVNAIDNSGKKGSVKLREIPRNLDTEISINFSGLKPDVQYLAIYHRNPTCKLEDSSIEKSVKGAFYPDGEGNAQVEDIVKDSVNRIGSVSLRTSKDFDLVACGSI